MPNSYSSKRAASKYWQRELTFCHKTYHQLGNTLLLEFSGWRDSLFLDKLRLRYEWSHMMIKKSLPSGLCISRISIRLDCMISVALVSLFTQILICLLPMILSKTEMTTMHTVPYKLHNLLGQISLSMASYLCHSWLRMGWLHLHKKKKTLKPSVNYWVAIMWSTYKVRNL